MLRTCKVWLFLFAFLSLSVVLASTAAPLYAQGKGKPGGGGSNPPPPPPVVPYPVRYEIRFFQRPDGSAQPLYILDSNNNGQAVGYYPAVINGVTTHRAFFYDAFGDNPRQVTDLTQVVTGLPEGWTVRRATGINQYGEMSAYIEQANSNPLVIRAVVIDVDLSVHIIPDELLSDYTAAYDINDDGDVVGFYRNADQERLAYVYSRTANQVFDLQLPVSVSADISPLLINNPIVDEEGNILEDAQIAGSLPFPGRRLNRAPFRMTLGGAIEVFDESYFDGDVEIQLEAANALNDRGEIGGAYYYRFPKKVKGWAGETRAYVMGASGVLSTYGRPDSADFSMAEPFGVCRLNSHGDFIAGNNLGGKPLMHQEWGYVNIEDMLLRPTDPIDAAFYDTVSFAWILECKWRLAGIGDRDDTGFPMLFGVVEFLGEPHVGFMLTPVPAE
jgi:hypothetical protein